MAITLVNHALANGDTLTIPSHQAGDLIIAIAYRNGSATRPTQPSGYRTIDQRSASNNNSMRLAQKTATSNNETFGTWTNATQVGCVVVRHTNYLIVGWVRHSGNTTDTLTYGAVDPNFYLEKDNVKNSILIGAYRTNNTSAISAPTGAVTIDNIQGSAAGCLVLHKAGTAFTGSGDGWGTLQDVVGSSLTAWHTFLLEIYDTRIPLLVPPTAPSTLSTKGGFGN